MTIKSKFLNKNIAIVLLSTVAFLSCTKKTEPDKSNLSPEQVTALELKEKGRRSYLMNCIACHNTDPKKDGVLGPAVFGSSRELLETRIIHGTYPEGYTPKRTSKTMAPFPHLKGDIEALHAYLN